MNEKIKEFAEQAWPGLPSHWWDRKDGEVAEAVNKFAELIINECSNVIEDYGLSLVGTDKHYLGETLNLSIKVQEASDKIKQHFGVEE